MTSITKAAVAPTNPGLENTASAAIPFVTVYNYQMEILIGLYLGRQAEKMAEGDASYASNLALRKMDYFHQTLNLPNAPI